MSIENTPLVSVLMTAYNREKFIGEAIESVLASTYHNFELIIVDDGSRDRTVEIARGYQKQDTRIKVFVNERNLGQFPNRNKAAEYATGEFVMYVDSDDKILENGMSSLVEVMLQNPSSSFGMQCRNVKEVCVLPSKTAIWNHFFLSPFLVHGPGATILKRNFLCSIGKYPVEYGIPGDMYFNLKACCYSPITLIPFDFMFYRIHGDQELSNTYDYLYNNFKYLNEALKILPLGLKKEEIEWLNNKNKRRFSFNIIQYFFKTLNVKKTLLAIRLAKFSFHDFITGVFYFRSTPKNNYAQVEISRI